MRRDYSRRAGRKESPKRDYYDVLGVPRGASKEEIKKAYRIAAKRYHPDISQEKDASSKFQEVSEAWEVLGNDEKRSLYDQYGASADEMGNAGGPHVDPFEAFREAFGGGMGGGNFNGSRGGFSFHSSQGGVDAEELEDLFSEFFGQARRPRGPRRGADVRLSLRLSFMDAARGDKAREIEWYEVMRDGRRGSKKKTSVPIPAGIDSGMQLRLQGKGSRGDPGAPDGDLYLEFQVDPDPYFKRDGADIHIELELNFVQATLGATLQVLTLDGLVDLVIPPGTQPAAKFRLRNKGLPMVTSDGSQNKRRGSQYVHTKISIPTSISANQKRLLQAFSDDENPETNLNASSARNQRQDTTSSSSALSALRRLADYFSGSSSSESSGENKNKSAAS